MAEYYLTKKAVEDLNHIWNYTFENWSEEQADKYYWLLIKTCDQIADDIHTGKIYSEVSNDLYGFRIGQHIIFYRPISENLIEITRILHDRMDLKNRISE